MKNQDFLSTDVSILAEELIKTYCIEIPSDITSIEQMKRAGNMLGSLTNSYSYLSSMLIMLKLYVRKAKLSGDNNLYKDMIARRDTVQDIVDIVKQQYHAVSRMITVKQEINEELKMSGGM